jgi:hypothetical protein
VADLVIQFGERSANETPDGNRRRERRFHFDKAPTVVFLAKPSYRPHEAGLRNVTNNGIALIAARRFLPGTQLAIRMPTTNPLLPEFRVAEVRHFAPDAGGGWLLGCRFSRGLSPDEMLAWMQKLPLER